MNDAATFEVDVRGWRRQVEDFSRRYGVSCRMVMLDQMRLWSQDLIKNTPPPTLAKGRAAVARDISKLFKPLDEARAAEAWRNELREKGYEIYRKTARGTMRISAKQVKAASQQELEKIHHANRNSRGRVRFDRATGEAWGGKHLIPLADGLRYIKTVQSHVGKLKAGWVPAARKFGGRIPSFVSRQPTVLGGATDAMRTNGDGYLEAANFVPYSNRLKGLLESTARTRRLDLEKHLKNRIRQVCERFNVARAA